MADFSKFRTAVSGFNRTDVVNYIESASMEHQKALRKLTDERDKLAVENAQLQTQLTGLQARLIQVQADNDALTEQVNTLAQEGSDLADQLKAAEAARAEAAAQPQPAPEAEPIEEEPAAETPEPPAQEPSLTEKELTAYRRAEQTERNAAVRARRIYTQLSNLCEDARSRYLDSARRSPPWPPIFPPALPACRTPLPRCRSSSTTRRTPSTTCSCPRPARRRRKKRHNVLFGPASPT